MIRFAQVSLRHGHRLALNDITFKVQPGELILIEGASGAGKSSILRLIAAMDRPSQGEIWIKEQNIGQLKPAAIPYLRRNLGLILQEPQLLNDRTAFENVMLPLLITGFPVAEAAERVHVALKKVGLKGCEQQRPASLSGGEQQRLAIARAIVHRPAILLADEPTAHLDAATAADVMQLFVDFQQAGITTLIASCDATSFAPAANQHLRLLAGNLAA